MNAVPSSSSSYGTYVISCNNVVGISNDVLLNTYGAHESKGEMNVRIKVVVGIYIILTTEHDFIRQRG